MEQHKWRFLQRAPTVPLSDFVDAVRAVEQRARCCYSESTAILNDDGDGFPKMLLLDGCFILEFSAKLSRTN
ncbi:Os12g0230301 [Oryza sativa Japonica Group]|uniref:Os12g0230301 protein n=1 Tax=Oryza sativa subsp. japonica TaxID=39947 RepID=A0A0N7KTS5_ORYSJ|nr:Os12g0230301 [Oryza sativa Japonica Group]